MNIFSLFNKNKQKIASIKNFMDFENLMKIKFCERVIFKILAIHARSQTKLVPDQFNRLDTYTNKQAP